MNTDNAFLSSCKKSSTKLKYPFFLLQQHDTSNLKNVSFDLHSDILSKRILQITVQKFGFGKDFLFLKDISYSRRLH